MLMPATKKAVRKVPRQRKLTCFNRESSGLGNAARSRPASLAAGRCDKIPLMLSPVAGGVDRRQFLAGNASEIVVYPDAGHGFNADYRPGYNKEAAQDGWKRLQQWFKKYGAA
jgi:dienelactone hydrolase